MILQSLFFTKLLGPYEGPSAWNDQQTYAYTPDEEFGNGAYTEHFTDLWGPKWKHMDNLDHVRPSMGVGSWDAASAWNLKGRALPEVTGSPPFVY